MAESVLHHHLIFYATTPTIALAHEQNSKLEKTNTAMAIPCLSDNPEMVSMQACIIMHSLFLWKHISFFLNTITIIIREGKQMHKQCTSLLSFAIFLLGMQLSPKSFVQNGGGGGVISPPHTHPSVSIPGGAHDQQAIVTVQPSTFYIHDVKACSKNSNTH